MSFRILALSGGGFLGLFSVRLLARLEEVAGRPIRRSFDLLCGTRQEPSRRSPSRSRFRCGRSREPSPSTGRSSSRR